MLINNLECPTDGTFKRSLESTSSKFGLLTLFIDGFSLQNFLMILVEKSQVTGFFSLVPECTTWTPLLLA